MRDLGQTPCRLLRRGGGCLEGVSPVNMVQNVVPDNLVRLGKVLRKDCQPAFQFSSTWSQDSKIKLVGNNIDPDPPSSGFR